jgi:hypothetical protein
LANAALLIISSKVNANAANATVVIHNIYNFNDLSLLFFYASPKLKSYTTSTVKLMKPCAGFSLVLVVWIKLIVFLAPQLNFLNVLIHIRYDAATAEPNFLPFKFLRTEQKNRYYTNFQSVFYSVYFFRGDTE